MAINSQQQPILRELGDGLILRRSSPADADALADFCARIHSDNGPDQPDLRVGAWVRDLLMKPHPTFHADDFTVVEEAATGRIVSSMNIIPQTWIYEGIPFPVGRPELVGTLPEYRSRGLIRLQFEEIHRWSAERGDMVQAITGIPYFYRQFGYEMAVDLGGRRFGYQANLPTLPPWEQAPIKIRRATSSDLPFAAEVYARGQQRAAITCQRGVDVLEYELNVQSMENANHFELMILENAAGDRLGYFQHPVFLGATGVSALGYELKAGASWLEVSPYVARYLWERGQEYAARDGGACHAFGFLLGGEHPAYLALGDIAPLLREPYAWFIRVPDLPGFIRHIAPALEKRMEGSAAEAYTGELKISFYRDGLRLVFTQGRLAQAEAWKPVQDEEGASFPGLTFLQLLFGYRSFVELHEAFPDCRAETAPARTLLDALFPKQLADIFPIY